MKYSHHWWFFSDSEICQHFYSGIQAAFPYCQSNGFCNILEKDPFVLFPEETKNSSVQQGLDDDAQEGTGTHRQEK